MVDFSKHLDPAFRSEMKAKVVNKMDEENKALAREAVTYHGRIQARPQDQAFLESIGVEIGDYDYKKNLFYAKASEQAYAALKDFSADFKAEMHGRTDGDYVRNIRDLTTREDLIAERAFLDWNINGPENDGRLTTDSSAWLDLWSDDGEKIDEAIRKMDSPNMKVVNTLSVGSSPEPF